MAPDTGLGGKSEGQAGATFVASADEVCRPSSTPEVFVGQAGQGGFSVFREQGVQEVVIEVARAGGFVLPLMLRTDGLSATPRHENSIAVELAVENEVITTRSMSVFLSCDTSMLRGVAEFAVPSDAHQYRTEEAVMELDGASGVLRVELIDTWARQFSFEYSISLRVENHL